MIVSKESLLSKKVACIFIINGMGAMNYSEEFKEILSDAHVVKRENIFSVDADLFCRPTPIKFLECIKLLREKYYETKSR